ncbi:hypothetical protein [Hymenobacter volaticus]|uniref:Uncharacterized protein n=1 Tax=Hymenobacter volaticus TaxID=2932254 RepID=A0ABY4G7Q0_9BACT|nr:hypothetical protein [Hymenobacter volaticus]UOQ66929.1 hypothetical protein MUN86_03175 [Hymenobacter volaticus]
MMAQFAQLYPVGLIRYTQSTFLELVTDTEVHRIDFRGKLSCRLQRGTYGPVSFHYDHHPSLTGVHGPLASLMARATPYPFIGAPILLAAIRQELQAQAGSWHNFVKGSWTMWWQRLVAHNIRPDLTRTGGIILDSVPVLVAEAVADICNYYGVETYYMPPQELWCTRPNSPSY